MQEIRLSEPSAWEQVPYSDNHSVALVTPRVACVVHSFEQAVLCVDADQQHRWTVGTGVGEGPGEFQTIGSVLQGDGSVIGVLDLGLSRISVFGLDSELLSTTPVPFLFRPVRGFSNVVEGTFQTASERIPGTTLARVEMVTGEILEEIPIAHPSEIGVESEATEGLTHGARDDAGAYWFGTGERELVEYDPKGNVVGVFAAPLWRPESPDQGEVDAFARTPLFGRVPTAQEVQRFSETQRGYLVRGRSLIADDRGRVWALTQRRTSERSELDVYRGGEQVAVVAADGRVLGFNVLDGTLVLLVELPSLDDEGLPVRALEWHELP